MISILIIPIAFIYSRGRHYEGEFDPLYVNNLYMGNMGGASIFCSQIPLKDNNFEINCPKGTTVSTKHAIFGIMSNQF